MSLTVVNDQNLFSGWGALQTHPSPTELRMRNPWTCTRKSFDRQPGIGSGVGFSSPLSPTKFRACARAGSPRRRECPFLPTAGNRGSPSPMYLQVRRCSGGQGSRGRRECLDHVIVRNERSLRRTLRSYFAYYQHSRTHLALAKDAPESRTLEKPECGRIVAIPQLGGLHHRYQRRAA
jgi:hypothetical protein